MANNYVESSFQFELENQKEADWWDKEGKRKVPEDVFNEDMENPISNDWEMEGNCVWFHGDEYIDVDLASDIIQRFLKECRPDGSIGFTWAETCSKPRLNEFGGGACFITADKIEWISAHDWLKNKREELKN